MCGRKTEEAVRCCFFSQNKLKRLCWLTEHQHGSRKEKRKEKTKERRGGRDRDPKLEAETGDSCNSVLHAKFDDVAPLSQESWITWEVLRKEPRDGGRGGCQRVFVSSNWTDFETQLMFCSAGRVSRLKRDIFRVPPPRPCVSMTQKFYDEDVARKAPGVPTSAKTEQRELKKSSIWTI